MSTKLNKLQAVTAATVFDASPTRFPKERRREEIVFVSSDDGIAGDAIGRRADAVCGS